MADLHDKRQNDVDMSFGPEALLLWSRRGLAPDEAEKGMSGNLKRLLTVNDVMSLLGVSRSWTYEAAARGELPCIRLGGMLRFDPDEIDRWLRQLPRRGSESPAQNSGR